MTARTRLYILIQHRKYFCCFTCRFSSGWPLEPRDLKKAFTVLLIFLTSGYPIVEGLGGLREREDISNQVMYIHTEFILTGGDQGVKVVSFLVSLLTYLMK